MYYYKLGLGHPKLLDIGRSLKGFLVDRTGILDQSHKVLTPLPRLPDVAPDYFTICDNRGKELLQKSQDENLEIRVAYSGGMDSTTALVSLLKFKDDYPQADIKVCLNQKSIDEYPYFYENFLKDNPQVELFFGETFNAEGVGENQTIGMNLNRDTGKDFFVVTGEIGDQIFGSKTILQAPQLAYVDYRDVFPEETCQFINPFIDEMPIKNTESAAVLSWMNFALKYQWCELRMYAMFDIPWEKYHHFFDTDEFQQWSMLTPMDVKFPEYTDTFYKLPTKEYIRDFVGDQTYYENKVKVPSMQTVTYKFDNPSIQIISIDEYFKKTYKDQSDRVWAVTENEDGTVTAVANNIEISM